jgi:hypothetical protein
VIPSQQSPGRALDGGHCSGLPSWIVTPDRVTNYYLCLQACVIEQEPHRHHAPVAVRQFQPLWRGLRNGLLIELAVILVIVAWVLT